MVVVIHWIINIFIIRAVILWTLLKSFAHLSHHSLDLLHLLIGVLVVLSGAGHVHGTLEDLTVVAEALAVDADDDGSSSKHTPSIVDTTSIVFDCARLCQHLVLPLDATIFHGVHRLVLLAFLNLFDDSFVVFLSHEV